MDNIADDYSKEFSRKLPDFLEFFNMWWLFEKAKNNSLADVKTRDFMYWLCMQSFVQNRVKQFSETLPKEGKEYTDALKKVDEQFGQTDS